MLTPEQVQFQQAVRDWGARRTGLRTDAQQALAAEMARERTPACANEESTRDYDDCLSKELSLTRQLQVLHRGDPFHPGRSVLNQPPETGPEGTALMAEQQVTEFDHLEGISSQYREAAAKIVFDQYKGGSLAPVISSEASLRLLRTQMEELAFLYDDLVSKR